MATVLTNPEDIKQVFKYFVQTQLDAYFERFQDGRAEMLFAMTETQSQAEKIQSFLMRSSVLSDRLSMAVAIQRLPNHTKSEHHFPNFGVFYVSEHTKADRAQVMNIVLVKGITRILRSHEGPR